MRWLRRNRDESVKNHDKNKASFLKKGQNPALFLKYIIYLYRSFI